MAMRLRKDSDPLKRTVRTESGCLEWTGKRSRQGYGATRYGKGKAMSAHRKSWLLHRGEIPKGLCVLHRCDNPPCINPDHLFLGTHADNAKDRDAKGRNGGHKRKVNRCANGHDYTPENTQVGSNNGGRTFTKWCRICSREKAARYKQRLARARP